MIVKLIIKKNAKRVFRNFGWLVDRNYRVEILNTFIIDLTRNNC